MTSSAPDASVAASIGSNYMLNVGPDPAAEMSRDQFFSMKSMASDSHGIPVGMKSVDSRWTIPVGGMATALAGCGFVIA